VFLTLRFGQVILVGSALGFLGMGAQPPTAELGMMAAQGRDFLFMAPHIATIPSLAIFVIVLAANLLGDAVRDVLDPGCSNVPVFTTRQKSSKETVMKTMPLHTT
jgi:ABC-type dipeptide/oligopeptide/nickel transport system permease subunit